MSRVRRRLVVRGVVQGVGFRPFVYRTAVSLGLAGSVCNRGDAGVEIVVEGDAAVVDAFLDDLRHRPPQLARIETIEVEPLDPTGETGFEIAKSHATRNAGGAIPPDTAICPACVEDVQGSGRYAGYWATSCTDCGPRFTVIEGLPYDRPRTSMRDFPLCSECEAEYTNPLDRRYHAQTTACPACGPRLALDVDPELALERAAAALRAGAVVAVKGLGGTHLACLASSGAACELLRSRLGRSGQPFALMARARDVEAIARVTVEERALLERPERPIVVLRQRAGALPADIAPGLDTVGVMLPYSGLHVLLLDLVGEPLVMTSANLPGRPMLIENAEIASRLRGIADHALVHDRRIVARCDDSVVRRTAGRTAFLRRSRGFTPQGFPIDLGPDPILAVGPETGVTFALYESGTLTLSQHIGSIDNLETYEFLRGAVDHLSRLLGVGAPKTVACDAHPQFLTSRFARELAEATGARVVPVQHHAAHAAATLAEHGIERAVVAVLDGYGYGADGSAWGGEVFACDKAAVARVGSLRPVRLPGGDLATRHPLRVVAGYLAAAGWTKNEMGSMLTAQGGSPAEVEAVTLQLERGLNAPWSTSAGRFLDAVAAWLGVCRERTYEGEPAMRLEAVAREGKVLEIEATFRETEGRREVDLVSVFARLVELAEGGAAAADIAATAQDALARGVACVAIEAARERGIDVVGLSGGVAVNDAIASRFRQSIEEAGLHFVANEWVPCGDGGVSFGQAVFAGRGMRLNA